MTPSLLLTRPAARAQEFSTMVIRAGWKGDICLAPLLGLGRGADMDHLPAALARAGALVFTSVHAVQAVPADLVDPDCAVWCVGARTAAAARGAGYVNVHVAGGDARALLAELCAADLRTPVIHLHGHPLAMNLAQALRQAGHQAEGVQLYQQHVLPLSRAAAGVLQRPGAVVAPVFSPRSSAALASALATLPEYRADLSLVAISDACVPHLAPLGVGQVRIARFPDASHMCEAVLQLQAELEAGCNPR